LHAADHVRKVVWVGTNALELLQRETDAGERRIWVYLGRLDRLADPRSIALRDNATSRLSEKYEAVELVDPLVNLRGSPTLWIRSTCSTQQLRQSLDFRRNRHGTSPSSIWRTAL